MSLFKELYVFFYNYSKILHNSSSSNVSEWTQSDLKNAIVWANHCEELSIKLKKKPYFSNFLLELENIFNYWKIPSKMGANLEKLILNATMHMKKNLIFNKYLSDEFRINMLNELLNEHKSKLTENNDENKISNLSKFEFSKICLKTCNLGNINKFETLFDYTLNHQKNIEFALTLLGKLKTVNFQVYKSIMLHLMNKRYLAFFMDCRSFSLFEFEQDKDLLKCYFCLLVTQIDELNGEKGTNSDSNMLIEHLGKLVESYHEPLVDCKNEMLFRKIVELKGSLNKQ